MPVQTSNAAIAQLGERQTEDLKVPGSIPGLGILCPFDLSPGPAASDEQQGRQPLPIGSHHFARAETPRARRAFSPAGG